MKVSGEKTPAAATGVWAFALAAAELFANTRCQQVVLLDLRGTSPVTQFFLIATGTSPRQMRTAIDELRTLGGRMGFAPFRTSGYESARWIVLDCVDVVAHVFDAESRDFYDLELLWGDAPRVDWRKELGLPVEFGTVPAVEPAARLEDDLMGAEEEDEKLDGRGSDGEEGDADVDEDAELDEPVVVEFPDESTGSNSVEFVEIDPPSKRRQRGRAVFPTPLEEQEDTTAEERAMGPVKGMAGSSESLDEDQQQRRAEKRARRDVEAVSDEDLPKSRLKSRPMGGVSAGLSSTSIGDVDEEDQLGDVALSPKEPSQRPRKRAMHTRADERGPRRAAPGKVKPKKAKASVVKTPAKKAPAKGNRPARGPAAKMVAKKKAVAKPKKLAAKKKKFPAAGKNAPKTRKRKA